LKLGDGVMIHTVWWGCIPYYDLDIGGSCMITSKGIEWTMLDAIASQNEKNWHEIFGKNKKYLDWDAVYPW